MRPSLAQLSAPRRTGCAAARRPLRSHPVPPSAPDIATVPAALLAGGLATRLRPITEKIPKALVDIDGRPFIDHQLALLRRNGIRRVVMCLGYRGEMVQEHCGDGSRYDMELKYSFDGEKL